MDKNENEFSTKNNSDMPGVDNQPHIRRHARRTPDSFFKDAVFENKEKDLTPFNENPQFQSEEKSSVLSNSEKAKKDEEALSATGNVFDWVKSFLFSLTAVIFIFTLLFRGVTVSGDSMLPTLESGEYLIISDLFHTPKTGDIVVVQSPTYKNGTEPLIKRVIATGGQTLKINFFTWQVWVDGVELKEDYILFEEGFTMNVEDLTTDAEGFVELVVDENCIFVMGDHRNDSLDSRSTTVGQIDQRYIMGRVLFRVTPISKFGKVD